MVEYWNVGFNRSVSPILTLLPSLSRGLLPITHFFIFPEPLPALAGIIPSFHCSIIPIVRHGGLTGRSAVALLRRVGAELRSDGRAGERYRGILAFSHKAGLFMVFWDSIAVERLDYQFPFSLFPIFQEPHAGLRPILECDRAFLRPFEIRTSRNLT